MRLATFTLFSTIVLSVITLQVFGQGNDCSGAGVICSDGAISFTPTGPGIDDFANPNNNDGCLSLENQSAWYYFEFNDNMPPNSIIEFTIDPNGGQGEDYDFAVFGPDVDCDNLGAPIRCSWAASSCGFCPATGLGMGATDPSEGAGGDGFVSGLPVEPGQGFYLLVDNWLGSSNGFELTWGGSAAPFLNCNVDPTCDITVDAGPPVNACAGGLPSVLQAIVTGTMGGESYLWTATGGGDAFLDNPFALNPNLNFPPGTAGIYTFTLTVTEGMCEESASVTVTVSDAPVPTITGPTTFCTGSFTTLDAGPGFASYQWSTGSNTQTTTVSMPGPVTVTVTNAAGCEGVATVNVTQEAGPTPAINGDLFVCNGGSTVLDAGFGYNSYLWSTNEVTQSITITAPGFYSVTVEDANGCVGSAQVTVLNAPGPEPVITGNNLVCVGQSATLDAGAGYLSYSWSNNTFNQTTTVNGPGVYSVTVEDFDGCVGIDDFEVFEIPPPTPTISGNQSICNGESNTLNAGAGYASYLWSTNDNTQSIAIDQPGEYTVTVTDFDGCEGEASIIITQLPSPMPTISGETTVCIGQQTTLNVDGSYFDYIWSNTLFGASVQVGAGDYTVTVTDNNGCTGTAMASVTESPDPAPTINGAEDFCPGNSIILGVDQSYSTYQWSDNSGGTSLTVDAPGTYSVTVSDNLGCMGSASVTVGFLPPPAPEITGETTICTGESTTLSADTGYDSYLWSNDEETQSITVDEPGTYTVTITTSQGCEGEGTVEITQFDNPEPNISGTPSFCDGDQTTLGVGAGYDTYLWSNNEETASINVTTPGTYEVTVTNANGCEGIASLEVEMFSVPVPGITGDTEFCEGSSANLDAEIGFNTYAWSNNTNDPSTTVQDGGTYTVTVTDDNGCQGENSFDVVENMNPTPQITGVDEICPEGAATLDAGGGYDTYLWSDSTGGQTIETSTAGTYSVTVTDQNGCSAETSQQVSVFESPVPEITGDTEFCEGSEATLVGESGYQSYLWSDNSMGTNLMVGTAGEYSLTVTDDNGCTGVSSQMVTLNDLPEVTISGVDAFCEGSIATLDAGPGFNTYLWSDNSTEQTLEVDTPGDYSVTVSSGAGCEAIDQFTIGVYDLPEPEITGELSICPEEPTTLSGTGGYASYLWSDGTPMADLTTSVPGEYILTVTDSNGCQGTTSVTVEELTPPSPTINGEDSFCEGTSTLLDAGSGYDTYLWSDNTDLQELTVTTPGTYMVTVTDGNGCQGIAMLEVSEDPLPQVDISGDLDFCEDNSTTLNAGTGFNSYVWTDNSSSETLTVSQPGDIGVTVTDDNGCVGEDIVTVVANPLPTPEITGIMNFCSGSSTTLGVDQDYTEYNWSTNSSENTISVNSPGSYSVTVTDPNGCVGEDDTMVEELEELEPEILGDPSFCVGTSVTLEGEPGFETYEWSTQTSGASVTIDQPGDVTLTVTDANGCEGATTITVMENPLPEPSISGIYVFCEGDSTELSAGNSFTDYIWSDNQTGSAITVTTSGFYEVTVTDNNGCEGSAGVDVMTNSAPEPEILGQTSFCPGTSTTLSVEDVFYSYNWTGNAPGTFLEVTQPGSYSLTVTDEIGCVGVGTVDVNNFVTAEPQIGGELEFCPEESTVISADGNFVEYLWSDNSTNQQLTVDEPGNYVVTVTDVNGCETTNAATVGLYTVIPAQITGAMEFCSGNSATVEAEGGYTSYSWSDNLSNSPTLTVTSGGDYEVTVIDANGCSATTEVEITENDLPEVTIGGSTSFCVGSFTTLNAGGTYESYLWSDNSTTSTLEVSVSGNYGLTVTDINGCENSDEVIVSEDTELNPVVTGPLDYCENGSTIINAGEGYATYNWSDGSQNQTLEVDAPGDYSVTVTDEGGCSGETTVSIIENPLPEPTIQGENVFCEGFSTSLDAGAGYDEYLWSHDENDQVVTIEEPGVYTVEVTDLNGCVASATVEVEEVGLPVFSITGEDFFCSGGTTTLSVPDNFQSYLWSSGEETASIEADEDQVYSVTVTSAAGCSDEESLNINEISLPTADAGEELTLDCDITSVQLGGGGSSQGSNFSYQWEGPGIEAGEGTTPFIQVDTAGTYSLIVTDDIYGCNSIPSVTEVANEAYEPQVVLQVLDILDCTTSSVTIDGSGSENGPTIIYNWYDEDGNPLGNPDQSIIETNEAGLYFLEVLDTLTGCSSMESVMVEMDEQYPIAIAGEPQHLDCINTTATLDGSGSTSGSGITYNWSTTDGNIQSGANTLNPTITEPGTYIIIVMDTINGCTNTEEVLVTQDIQEPTAIAGQDQELDCVTPSVTLDGTGSSSGANFTYDWSFQGSSSLGDTDLIIDVEQPGMYTLQVTNETNGCTSSDVVEVSENEAVPTELMLDVRDVNCFGENNGAIFVNDVIGGTPPFMYSLNGEPFSSLSAFGSLPAGNYDISLQDVTGCELETTVTIQEGNDLQIDLGEDVYLDLGESTDLFAQVNIPDEEINTFGWTAFDSLDCATCPRIEVGPFRTTTYSATVTDGNGCLAKDEVTVFINRPYEVFVPNAFSPNGDGINDILMVFAGPDVKEVKSFLVFNRWGESVFEVYGFQPNDPFYGWNGNYRSRKYNAAVFAYFAEVEFIDGEVRIFKGDVTLVK